MLENDSSESLESSTELLTFLLTLWVWKETGQAWTMFSKLKALFGFEKIRSYRFDNSELSLPRNSMCHGQIPT